MQGMRWKYHLPGFARSHLNSLASSLTLLYTLESAFNKEDIKFKEKIYIPCGMLESHS